MKPRRLPTGLSISLSLISLILSLALFEGLHLSVGPAAQAATTLNTDRRRLAAQAVPPDGGPPEGLTAGEWASIQAGVHRAEYFFTWHEPSAAHQAPNRAQGFQTSFASDGAIRVSPWDGGADWTWGLRLQGYGYGGPGRRLSRPGEQIVKDNHLERQWTAGLSEWAHNDERGLEHGFTLHAPPRPGRKGARPWSCP